MAVAVALCPPGLLQVRTRQYTLTFTFCFPDIKSAVSISRVVLWYPPPRFYTNFPWRQQELSFSILKPLNCVSTLPCVTSLPSALLTRSGAWHPVLGHFLCAFPPHLPWTWTPSSPAHTQTYSSTKNSSLVNVFLILSHQQWNDTSPEKHVSSQNRRLWYCLKQGLY